MQGIDKLRTLNWSVFFFLTGCTWVPIMDGAQGIRVFKFGEKPAPGCHVYR